MNERLLIIIAICFCNGSLPFPEMASPIDKVCSKEEQKKCETEKRLCGINRDGLAECGKCQKGYDSENDTCQCK